MVDVEPAKDVLNTPEPLLTTESIGAAAIPIIDDFLSCEPNLDFLDKILGYDSSQKSAGHLRIQGGIGAGKGKGKERREEREKCRERR